MPQKYNPLVMQMAMNMMSQGGHRQPAYGTKGGIASGLTSAGSSLLGAMMAKKQMKAQGAEQDLLMSNMGYVKDENGNWVLPEGGASSAAPTGGGASPMGGGAGERMAASMAGIPPEFLNMKPEGQQIDPKMKEFMGKLMPEYAALDKSFSDTASAPTGGSTVAKQEKTAVAPETKKVQKTLADNMPEELRGVVAAMMASGDPQMKQLGLATAMGYMPQKLTLADRFTVAGGNIFDRVTQTFRQPRKQGYEFKTVSPGQTLVAFNYETGQEQIIQNPFETEADWIAKGYIDESATEKMGVPVWKGGWSTFDPNTRKREFHKSNITTYIGTDPSGQGQPYGKRAMGDIEAKIVASRANLSRLEDIDALLLDDDFIRTPGRIKQWIFETADSFGDVLTEKQQKSLGDYSEFRAAVSEGINMYIKMITGAQMSEAEAARLMTAMPNLKDKSPTVFRAKLKRAVGATKSAIEMYDEMRGRGLSHERAQAEADNASRTYLRENKVSDFMDEGKSADQETKVMDGITYILGDDGVWRKQ